MKLSPQTRQHIERLRVEVCDLHAELIRWNLVVWTAGNVSARVPGADLLVVKPSGVDYQQLTPQNMVVTDFDGDGGRGRRRAVVGHLCRRLCLRAPGLGRRCRAHPFHLRDRLCRPS